jgi:hypothetical protein
MARTTPVNIAGKLWEMKLGAEAASDALFELQSRIPAGMLGGLKLTFDVAEKLIQSGDVHAIAIFLKNALTWKRRGLQLTTVYGWLDDHCDADGHNGHLLDFAEPLSLALDESGLIERERVETDADGKIVNKETLPRRRPSIVGVPEPAG